MDAAAMKRALACRMNCQYCQTLLIEGNGRVGD
jgi:hypothetical protein